MEINTNSSAMAERPRELDQRFQGGQFEAKLYRVGQKTGLFFESL